MRELRAEHHEILPPGAGRRADHLPQHRHQPGHDRRGPGGQGAARRSSPSAPRGGRTRCRRIISSAPERQDLFDLADVAIDDYNAVGDCGSACRGSPPIAPQLERRRLLHRPPAGDRDGQAVRRPGIEPPVWRTPNCAGGDEFNARYIAKYFPESRASKRRREQGICRSIPSRRRIPERGWRGLRSMPSSPARSGGWRARVSPRRRGGAAGRGLVRAGRGARPDRPAAALAERAAVHRAEADRGPEDRHAGLDGPPGVPHGRGADAARRDPLPQVRPGRMAHRVGDQEPLCQHPRATRGERHPAARRWGDLQRRGRRCPAARHARPGSP